MPFIRRAADFLAIEMMMRSAGARTAAFTYHQLTATTRVAVSVTRPIYHAADSSRVMLVEVARHLARMPSENL